MSGLSLQFVDGGWVPAEQQRTRASFRSSQVLDCSVPALSSAGVNTEELAMDRGPYARWEMKVPPVWLRRTSGSVFMKVLSALHVPGDQRWFPVQPGQGADPL